jgi:Family of unknown function (DUF5317)
MFILYAIPIGIVAGYLLGGRLERLGDLRLRWVPLALAGLVIQLVLFADALGTPFGDATPAIYVGSNLLVFAAVLRNIRVPGMALAAVGAGCNLAAIVANGGYMPADPEALASVGLGGPGYTNSIVLTDPALPFLTDIFAMPTWLPAANIFSLGDVLLGAGVALTIALAMRRPAATVAATSSRSAGAPGSGRAG